MAPVDRRYPKGCAFHPNTAILITPLAIFATPQKSLDHVKVKGIPRFRPWNLRWEFRVSEKLRFTASVTPEHTAHWSRLVPRVLMFSDAPLFSYNNTYLLACG